MTSPLLPSAAPAWAPPTSTYRLQLQSDFPFAAAEATVPYLASLGVSHLHLSPVLQAAPGSSHGYDVVDHSAISAELGGEAGLRSLAATAREHGLGLVVDIVPNHMAVPAPEYLNEQLWSVLRHGPVSPYARWFDIEWEAQQGRILMPVLGDRIGAELDAFSLDKRDGETILRYHDHAFPVRPGTEQLPLPDLLRRQWYRLAWWRIGATELNYRRFFTISDLICVRVEDPEVFQATHGLLLRLMDEGLIDGFRIDHPDGLADPRGYLRRLDAATGGRWTVVEKILTGNERLPSDWPVAGTTGYDALHHVDGLFVCHAGTADIDGVYTDFARQDTPGRTESWTHSWTETARHAAREAATCGLAAEVGRLTSLAYRICAAETALRDHSARSLRTAVEELLIAYPVYRPYVVPGEPAPPEAVRDLDAAAEQAAYAFDVPQEAAAVDVVRDLALGLLGRGHEKDEFVARFAQVSSAVRAKGVEDKAFYRWYPLLSANEVGGEPGRPAVDPHEFHVFCAHLQRDWPTAGTALSTHDTKRSADVRARLSVLSEVPDEWRAWLDDMAARHVRYRSGSLPDRHAEYLIWQTYAGAGPDSSPERLLGTLRKALREADLHTGWTSEDPAYEEAVLRYAEDAYQGAVLFAEEFAATWGSTERANVLGAALLHLTMPGVPDVYQGTETVTRTMVDPDNRLAVDFARRVRLLRSLDAGEGGVGESGPGRTGPGRTGPDGSVLDGSVLDSAGLDSTGLDGEKLRVTATALRLRRTHPEWFGARGDYAPLYAHGPAAAHIVAFARARRVVPVVTRLNHRLERDGGWRDTVLPLPGPSGAWTDVLTDRPATPGPGGVRLADLLDTLPVALLVRE